MNPDVKALWITALRSGKYTQGTGVLKRTTSEGKVFHCCLGVLGDIAVAVGITREIPEPAEVLGHAVSRYEGDENERSVGYLPNKVCEWAGINTEVQSSLAGENDREMPFSDIADLIERTL